MISHRMSEALEHFCKANRKSEKAPKHFQTSTNGISMVFLCLESVGGMLWMNLQESLKSNPPPGRSSFLNKLSSYHTMHDIMSDTDS